MLFKCAARILSFIIIWMLLAGLSFADRIVLRDGTVEESERVWISDKFIHFILKGTRSVEIRYAIDIVERVERSEAPSPADIKNTETVPDNKKQNVLQEKFSQERSSHTAETNSAARIKLAAALRKIETESKGIRFYDPRRAKRYRVNKTGAYNDLHSALKELAATYGRTPDWVADHMGEENDVSTIHRNLATQRIAEMMSEEEAPPKRLPSSQNKADEAPVGHKTSKAGQPVSIKPSSSTRGYPKLNIDKGTKFYDPRRIKKYWTENMARHDTLHDALAALARQYDVTPQWIEDHMGESNLLTDIHQSIRSSLLDE